MNALRKVGATVAVLIGLVALAALALWCYFLLSVLHWVAIKVGFSDGLADLLVGIVVVAQGLPLLLVLGAAVAGAITRDKLVVRRR